MTEDIKQGDCDVCTGKEVVENGVCRNCGAGKEVDSSPAPVESVEPSTEPVPSTDGSSSVSEEAMAFDAKAE